MQLPKKKEHRYKKRDIKSINKKCMNNKCNYRERKNTVIKNGI